MDLSSRIKALIKLMLVEEEDRRISISELLTKLKGLSSLFEMEEGEEIEKKLEEI